MNDETSPSEESDYQHEVINGLWLFEQPDLAHQLPPVKREFSLSTSLFLTTCG